MNIINVLWGVVGFGVASLVPLYAEERYHLSALNSGTLLTARGVGVIIIGALVTLMLRRTGYRGPIIVGYSVVAAGILLMSISPQLHLSPYVWLSMELGLLDLETELPTLRRGTLRFSLPLTKWRQSQACAKCSFISALNNCHGT
jgi:hypothetical protein